MNQKTEVQRMPGMKKKTQMEMENLLMDSSSSSLHCNVTVSQSRAKGKFSQAWL